MNRSRLTTYFILASFIGLAVFGFAVMGGHSMDGEANCIALIGQGTPCLNQNMLTMAVLHADFFQRLTNISILLAFLIFAWVFFKKIPINEKFKISARAIERVSLVFKESYQPFLKWLSLHEQIA